MCIVSSSGDSCHMPGRYERVCLSEGILTYVKNLREEAGLSMSNGLSSAERVELFSSHYLRAGEKHEATFSYNSMVILRRINLIKVQVG